MTSRRIPFVGAIVHYFWPECDIPASAIVTGVLVDPAWDGEVDLVVFETFSISFSTGVPHRSTMTRHCWDWPPAIVEEARA